MRPQLSSVSRLVGAFILLAAFAACNDSSTTNNTPPTPTPPTTAPNPQPGTLPPGLPPNGGGGGGGHGGPASPCSMNEGSCTIATAVVSPASIATDDTWVYFGTEGGVVVQLSKDGSLAQVLATGQGDVRAIAVDGSGLYWVGGDNVMAIPAGGSAPMNLYTASNDLPGIALDGSHVYVTSGAEGKIFQIAKTGGLEATLVSGVSDAFGVATDGYALYWTNANAGTVSTTVLSTGTTTTIATGEGTPGYIALDPTTGGATPSNPNATIYWTDYTAGAPSGGGPGLRSQDVFCADASCTKVFGGPSMTLYGNGEVGAWAVAVDGTYAYWTNRANGTVNEALLGTNQVGTLVAGLSSPAALAADGTYLFYAADSATNGLIGRVSP